MEKSVWNSPEEEQKVFFYRELLQAVSANIITEHGANNQAYLIFDNAPSHRNIEEEEALGGHLLSIDFQNTPNSSIPKKTRFRG